MQTGFKAANITVASGTLLNTNTDLRPDGGGAGLGSVTVKSGATLQFSNILISIQRVGTGSGTSHFGTLTVEAGGIMEFSGTSSPVIGAATFALNGTVIYSGAGNQTLAIRGTNTGGVQPNTYTNLTIDGGGNKTLPFPIAINGTLNLISGYVINNITDLLTMNSGSSATGASNSSFVNGPVAKTGSTNFEFPVGKTGTGYVPISIGNLSASETFTAEYIRADALGLGTITAPGLAKVSRCEYWTLNRTGAATTADVTLHWSAVNNCGVLPYIVQMADLTVAHFDGTNWDAFGPAGLTTGLPAAGTVTWQNVSTFSPFTIGSISFLNPLPIVVNYLQGTKQGSSHHLNWKVTCNSTPTATMVLERSADNRNFAAINTVTADALRCAQPFNYVDASPLAGVNYYRLRITDANGKVTFSNTIAMVNKLSGIAIVGITKPGNKCRSRYIKCSKCSARNIATLRLAILLAVVY
ncbi:MAG: hypothetical protein IPP48_15140 [Chitinophagaceae bacterium]|nr:hypothetical protein [Chitinophagaceae bacterium]